MTVLSTPACRRFIAAVCRSVCGETFLFFSVGQLRLAVVACLVTRSAIASRLSCAAAAGGEQWLLRLAVALLEPFAEDGDGLAGQRRGSLFPALPQDLNVWAGAEVRVLAAQAGELCDAQPGLDRERQQRVVATADPAGAVRRGEQRVDLFRGEVGDDCAVEPFGRDRDHARDQRGVLGVAQRGEAEHRMDRRQPRVASPGAVPAFVLEMVEERGDQRRVEILDLKF